LTKLGDSNGQGRLYWKMPKQDARDLAIWWRTEDLDVKNGQKSIRDKQVGGLAISMSSSTTVNVLRRNRAAEAMQIGYTLPREVPEYLANSELVTRDS
jgi:hypothetical protein